MCFETLQTSWGGGGEEFAITITMHDSVFFFSEFWAPHVSFCEIVFVE